MNGRLDFETQKKKITVRSSALADRHAPVRAQINMIHLTKQKIGRDMACIFNGVRNLIKNDFASTRPGLPGPICECTRGCITVWFKMDEFHMNSCNDSIWSMVLFGLSKCSDYALRHRAVCRTRFGAYYPFVESWVGAPLSKAKLTNWIIN